MIWIIVIFLPLLLACLSWQTARVSWLHGLALTGAAVPAVLVALGLLPEEPLELPGILLGVSFGLDTIRGGFLALTAVLWGIAGAYAWSYLRDDPRRGSFGFFYLLTMSGNFGLIVAQDVPAFYTFFVLMTFASYGMVIHSGSDEARRAGRIYLIMAILGELFIFVGLNMAVQAAGSIRIADLASGIAGHENLNWILLFGFLGFGVKAGIVPLYFWLPLAHPVAPTPASAVLSGAMIKAGVLGWIHLSPVGEVALPGWAAVVIGLGLVATFVAVAIGLFQVDAKTTLAYSSISQMGVITLLFGLALAAPDRWETIMTAMVLYVWNHGIAKGALFLGTGVAQVVRRGRAWVMAGLVIPALALAGAPFTGGAYAKYALKGELGAVPGLWSGLLLWLIAASSLATTLLLGRFLWLAWKKMGTGGAGQALPLVVPWVLLLVIVAVGTYGLVVRFALEAPFPELALMGILEALLPVLLGGLLITVAWRHRFGRTLPTIPPGDAIVWIERLVVLMRLAWARLASLSSGRSWDVAALFDRLLAVDATEPAEHPTHRHIGQWSLVGAFFLMIILGFIWALG